MALNFFTGRFRPKPLPGTALYSTTTNRSGPVLRYDDQSGNLFTEEIFRTPSDCLSLLDRPTYAERQVLFSKYPRTNPKRQDPTLFNLCRLIVLQHVESLTPQVLSQLPWHYGKIIWEDLIHATADSFTIFRNFCEVYGHEPDFHPGNRELLSTQTKVLESRRLKLPMTNHRPWTPLYIPYLSSNSAAWLVNLTLTGGFDLWELTELTGLQNLVSLKLCFPLDAPHRTLARVFKNWVTNKRNFENLRILRLSYLPESVVVNEGSVLGALDGLPALRLVELRIRDKWSKPTMYNCDYLKRNSFGIGRATGWNIICWKSTCRNCLQTVLQDSELAEIVLGGIKLTDSDTNLRMHRLAPWIIKKHTAGGQRKVILNVSSEGSFGLDDGTLFFYRKEFISRVQGISEPKRAKKRLLLSDGEDEDVDVPSRRMEVTKVYRRAKATKRQDIGSLLNSFT